MVIIGKTYSRHISTLNILAISAFFLLPYNPLFITDVGFQLSYLTVSGLIVLQPVVYKWVDLENKWADKLWVLCSVSIAAQIITFPLSAFYFHQFPVYFLISNLVIVIPTAIIMYAGMAYLLLPDIPFISSVLGWILEKSILLMNKVLALTANIQLLLIFDKQLQKLKLPEKIKLDYLCISGNPDTDIDFISKYYDYGLLIIDNNNSNYLITSLENRANAMHINYRILGRNKSVIFSSN
jgi:predicted membrane metal-binding protein